ncbi:MAG: ATP-binding protein [Caldimonas sp.]
MKPGDAGRANVPRVEPGPLPPAEAGSNGARVREQALQEREGAVTDREDAARVREGAAGLREEAQRVVDEAQGEVEARNSELRRANAHLVIATLAAEESTEAAELAHRRQDEFLAMLAHELRNPLAPIRSAAALLERVESAEPMLPLIRKVIQRQVAHMARLIDDLLDVSRVTQGKVILQRQPTAVTEFVDQAVETCRELIDARHQQLTLDMPVTPLYVDGDPVRLAQIIGNLLHNAAKYTQEGGAIALSVRRRGDAVVIRVSDNGIGILAEALPHIFELFTQNDRSLSSTEGGLGIGLTVVRSMVELHGGSVDARSGGLGQGSEFVVTLPRMEHVVERAVATRAGAATASAQARILIIDDNADAGEILAMLLRVSGHEVEIALDGPSALKVFAQVRPQVVLCDIGLPGMDGYQIAARMREESQEPVPVMIALTGYGDAQNCDRALAAGFDHHVVKPADPEALLRLIDSALLTASFP